jgi:hypothetical protein
MSEAVLADSVGRMYGIWLKISPGEIGTLI